MSDPQLRAADSDREAVAAMLGRALSDGRLTVDEYEERLAKAYAARTYADLDLLTADLPGAAATPRPAPVPGPASPSGPAPVPAPHPAGVGSPGWGPGVRAMWASWLSTSLVVTGIWLAISIGNGRPDNFWPVWVIVPWGALVLARTITGGTYHPRDRHRSRSRGRGRDR